MWTADPSAHRRRSAAICGGHIVSLRDNLFTLLTPSKQVFDFVTLEGFKAELNETSVCRVYAWDNRGATEGMIELPY